MRQQHKKAGVDFSHRHVRYDDSFVRGSSILFSILYCCKLLIDVFLMAMAFITFVLQDSLSSRMTVEEVLQVRSSFLELSND
jgi:hypothetical protein